MNSELLLTRTVRSERHGAPRPGLRCLTRCIETRTEPRIQLDSSSDVFWATQRQRTAHGPSWDWNSYHNLLLSMHRPNSSTIHGLWNSVGQCQQCRSLPKTPVSVTVSSYLCQEWASTHLTLSPNSEDCLLLVNSLQGIGTAWTTFRRQVSGRRARPER